VVGLKGGG